MSCMPQAYKDKIDFINPKTMDEVTMHTMMCFTKFKWSSENIKTR
jgi:hypothetical protein